MRTLVGKAGGALSQPVKFHESEASAKATLEKSAEWMQATMRLQVVRAWPNGDVEHVGSLGSVLSEMGITGYTHGVLTADVSDSDLVVAEKPLVVLSS